MVVHNLLRRLSEKLTTLLCVSGQQIKTGHVKKQACALAKHQKLLRRDKKQKGNTYVPEKVIWDLTENVLRVVIKLNISRNTQGKNNRIGTNKETTGSNKKRNRKRKRNRTST